MSLGRLSVMEYTCTEVHYRERGMGPFMFWVEQIVFFVQRERQITDMNALQNLSLCSSTFSVCIITLAIS